MIEAVGIVVPVHDEQELLPGCLAALERARLSVNAHLVVVLDACTDDSARIAGRHGLVVDHRCVGWARAAGARAVLDHFADVPPDRVWLAMTDADSRVPADWLAEQLAFADRGIAGVAGTVTVEDWGDFHEDHRRSYEDFYARTDHVHGANLGVRADAYLASGGFPPIPTGEDIALWDALVAGSFPVVMTRTIPVVTSSRLVARAPDGFAAFLRDWAA